MIVFSSFIAVVGSSVTQLIQQSAHIRRDWFVLRLYLRQRDISTDLKIRVNRYVGLITAHMRNRVDRKDVKLFEILSRPLQVELLTELYERHLTMHPLFLMIGARSHAIMRNLCCTAIREARLCRGDILFSLGQLTPEMYLITSGCLKYVTGLMAKRQNVESGEWFCEAVLWTDTWVTCGRMTAKTECEMIALDAHIFREVVTRHHTSGIKMPRDYAASFIEAMNERVQSREVPLTDCHSDLKDSEAVENCLNRWGYEEFADRKNHFQPMQMFKTLI
jgi:CRP-like cAMP-binding protein